MDTRAAHIKVVIISLASVVALTRFEFPFATFALIIVFRKIEKTLSLNFRVHKFKLVIEGTLIDDLFLEAAFVVPFFAFQVPTKVKSIKL